MTVAVAIKTLVTSDSLCQENNNYDNCFLLIFLGYNHWHLIRIYLPKENPGKTTEYLPVLPVSLAALYFQPCSSTGYVVVKENPTHSGWQFEKEGKSTCYN